VKLRATPINGDAVYVEVGGQATTASHKLSGRDYETGELEVSFLAVDSSGEHETGDPVTWHNRITLKGRIYNDGTDKRAELRAAPPAPIRYSTDGSDPKVAGGAYAEPLLIPEGARLVLAVAEKKGIVSDVLQLTVNWDQVRDEEHPIDTQSPATWRPTSHPQKIFSFSTTHNAYGFIERLKKHGGRAAVQRLAVLDGQWVDLQLADDLLLDAEQIRATVEQLRALLSAGEVTIEASALWFPTGQQLLDYVRDIAAELPRIEVEP
jgi:hypothetical protein